MSLMYLVLFGIILYALLYAGKKLLKVLTGNLTVRNAVIRFFPVIETGAWIVYTFWGVKVLFGGMRHFDLLVTAMAALLVFGIAWFVFRDLFAGIMIKSEYRLQAGQIIKTPVAEGRIISLGSRFMELENEKGERLTIPFSKIGSHWISLPADAQNSLSHHIVIGLPDKIEPAELITRIYREMMGMPWIIGPPPRIRLLKSPDNILDIRCHLLKEEHAILVEEKLRRLVKELAGTDESS